MASFDYIRDMPTLRIVVTENCELCEKGLNKLGFLNNFFTIKKVDQIVSFMMMDKKNNSKNIKLMLIKTIGGPIIEKEFSYDTVKLFLKKKLIN